MDLFGHLPSPGCSAESPSGVEERGAPAEGGLPLLGALQWGCMYCSNSESIWGAEADRRQPQSANSRAVLLLPSPADVLSHKE